MGAADGADAAVEGGLDSPWSFAQEERTRLAVELVRRAIAGRRVMLAFQPVVQARDTTRIAFHEGLVRVMDEAGRIIPARDFLPAIETAELGRQIDTLALGLGLDALAAEPGLRLAINMSARSIGYPRWTRLLDRALSADPTIGERLILEITEASAMLMPDLVTVFMTEWQRRGVAFALDDFGAGYTALRHFKSFSFDILKIDGQFIRGIHRDPDNQVMTQALISIARHFDMFTVAEYVEDARDAAYLQQIGIDCLQGYLFGSPTTAPPWRDSAAARRRA